MADEEIPESHVLTGTGFVADQPALRAAVVAAYRAGREVDRARSAEMDAERVAEIIRSFPWHNYGLDEVGEIAPEAAEYATALAARIVRDSRPEQAKVWALPDEPGPEVTRLRPVEQYPGDDSIWLDRHPEGWRVVMRGRPGAPLEWVMAYGFGAAQAWGGRPLLDATHERAAKGDGYRTGDSGGD